MSHITKIELEVKDLGILNEACKRLGLNFVRNQRSFKWYGRKDAKCDHAIKVTGANYEIGVVKTNGRYDLQCDYYDSNIEEAIGKDGGKLKQSYAVTKTKTEARRKGYSVIEKQTDNGVQSPRRDRDNSKEAIPSY